MGKKRKGRKETNENNRNERVEEEEEEEREEIEEEEEEDGGRKEEGGFFACYLLTSLCPRFKSHTYIGYTVNPRRRIRQHNGEIGSGAWRTKRKRPWEMVLCIYGFPTNVAALQFEWAWQHPVESLAVRKAAASFKSLSGLANKIKLAHTMLTLPSWQSLNLTVNFFSTKYQTHISGCPTLPAQMRRRFCSMDDLPCYNENAQANDECDWDEECDRSGSSHETTQENPTESVAKPQSPPPTNHNAFLFEENGQKHIDQEDRTSLESSRFFIEWHGNLPHTREEDQGEHLITDDSLSKLSTSFESSYFVENVSHFGSVEDFSTNSDQSIDKQPTTASVVDEDVVLIQSLSILSRDIEIIDLFTPSPRHTIKSSSKRTRRTLYPEIIDLT